MPISPTPPSGAKTSSSAAPAISCRAVWWRPGSSRALERDDVAGRDHRFAAVRLDQNEGAVLVDRIETSSDFPVGKTHADVLSEPGGAREPIRADRRKAVALMPLRKPSRH